MNLWYNKRQGGVWKGALPVTNQGLNDQQFVSSLWAFFPDISGEQIDVLDDKLWLVWEDSATHIMFAEAPHYPVSGGSKSQAYVVG